MARTHRWSYLVSGIPHINGVPTIPETVYEERPPRGFHGTAITKYDDVYAHYSIGTFWYQFRDDFGESNVHLCDNGGELNWLSAQVSKGARIVIVPAALPKQL